jgi:hypothetical protein
VHCLSILKDIHASHKLFLNKPAEYRRKAPKFDQLLHLRLIFLLRVRMQSLISYAHVEVIAPLIFIEHEEWDRFPDPTY